MSGYVHAARDRFRHPLFKASKRNPFCTGYAWDWIVARAAWRATTYNVRGKVVTVQRGQFFASHEEMATAWGWSRAAVIRFVVRLQTEHMIVHTTEHLKGLITVCNYSKYQTEAEQTGHKSGRNNGPKADTNRTLKETLEEGEEKKEKTRARADSPNGHGHEPPSGTASGSRRNGECGRIDVMATVMAEARRIEKRKAAAEAMAAK